MARLQVPLGRSKRISVNDKRYLTKKAVERLFSEEDLLEKNDDDDDEKDDDDGKDDGDNQRDAAKHLLQLLQQNP